jgi:hypothetical protein
MKRRALVIGTGVAGLSCAQLLACQGWEVEVCKSRSRPEPTLVLNDITCGLLCDIWQAGNELLDGSHILNERKVVWGLGGTVSTVVQRSVVIRGDRLVERLLKNKRPFSFESRRPRGRAFHNLLRSVFLLSEGTVLAVRHFETQQTARGSVCLSSGSDARSSGAHPGGAEGW